MSGVWFWFPAVGPIRISTVLGAALVFAVVLVARRDALRAVVTVVAWLSVFETIYHVVGIVGFHWALANFAWETAAVAGWVILAAVLGIWPDLRFTAVFTILMAAWILAGFHYNIPGQRGPINVGNELLNEAAKTSLGLAYLVGALRSKQKELVKTLIDRDRASGIRGYLHLDRVLPGLDRPLDGVVPDHAVAGQAAGKER